MSKIFWLDKKTISILCYHSISNDKSIYSVGKKEFEQQMEKIARHAKFVSLSEILEFVEGKEINGPLVSITIDDGYADAVEILPIVKKYNIPVTLFVLSNPQNADRYELDNKQKLLNWEQIKYLHSQGWEIGSHSATHTDFKTLTDEEIEKEVIDSKKTLEKKLGFKINYFAYPKGIYNSKIIEAVKKAGYKGSFAVSPGCISKSSDKWSLPRTIVDKSHSDLDFPAAYSVTTFSARVLFNKLFVREKSFREIIKRATLFELILASIISAFEARKKIRTRITAPKYVGNYKLIYEIKKIKYPYYGTGTYEYKNKKYFIKTWKGSLKNSLYYLLVNEYLVNKTLHKNPILLNESKIELPRAIEYFNSNNSLSVVFEHVEGKPLSQYSLNYQAKTVSTVIKALNKLSLSIDKNKNSPIPKMDLYYYLFSLPFFILIQLLTKPSKVRLVLKALICCFKNLKSVRNTNFVLAHRDLTVGNFLINKNKIYLMDCGGIILTLPSYDISYLAVKDANNYSYYYQIAKKIGDYGNDFLKTFMLIQFSKLDQLSLKK